MTSDTYELNTENKPYIYNTPLTWSGEVNVIRADVKVIGTTEVLSNTFTVGAEGLPTGVEGVVTSHDNQPLANVSVTASKVYTDEKHTTITDSQGNYKFRLVDGYYKITFEKKGYLPLSHFTFLNSENITSMFTKVLYPESAANAIRVDLDWHEKDVELELRMALLKPNGELNEYINTEDNFIFTKEFSKDELSTKSIMSEHLDDGEYQFYVYNRFDPEDFLFTSLSDSKANVSIKHNGKLYNFEPPANSGRATHWSVFTLKVSNNGKVKKLIPTNRILNNRSEESIIIDGVKHSPKGISEFKYMKPYKVKFGLKPNRKMVYNVYPLRSSQPLIANKLYQGETISINEESYIVTDIYEDNIYIGSKSYTFAEYYYQDVAEPIDSKGDNPLLSFQ